MKVALDLDGTLAKTYDVSFKLLGDDEHGYEDIESWSWGLNKYGDARFLSSVWHSWTLRPHEIEPMEVLDPVHYIYDEVDKLDVLTADPGHLGIKESKQKWLNDHDVPHDELRISPMGGHKSDFDYDIFIDDNPHMPEQMRAGQLLLLYDAPYNQDKGSDRSIRIFNLWEAREQIAERKQVA